MAIRERLILCSPAWCTSLFILVISDIIYHYYYLLHFSFTLNLSCLWKVLFDQSVSQLPSAIISAITRRRPQTRQYLISYILYGAFRTDIWIPVPKLKDKSTSHLLTKSDPRSDYILSLQTFSLPYPDMTSVSSKSSKTKKKKSTASVREDRVDQYLAQAKERQKIRSEARKLKKQRELEAEEKRQKELDELEEKRMAAELKRKSDAEFAECEKLMAHFEKEVNTDPHSEKTIDVTQSESDEESDEALSDDVNKNDDEEMTDNTGSNSAQKSDNPATKTSPTPSPELLKYIQSSTSLPSPPADTNDDASADTAAAGNTPSSAAQGKTINDALNEYKTQSITTHVLFCKAKIYIPENGKPTEKMRNTFIMFMTTLLKIDKDFVLYGYKDASNARYLKLPVKLPETPSKMQEFFFGRYRPGTSSTTIWPDVRIGFNIDPETFFSDAKSLLEDKGNYGIYKKEIQAAETADAGFFLFSHVYQDRARL